VYVYLCIFVFVNWVCWVRGNFSGEPGHVYFVCVFPLCGVLAGTILIVHFGGVGGGTVRIFFSLWFCSGGYGTVGLVRGRWSVFSFRFLQFAVRSFGGWVSLVGNFLCYTFSVGSL
jgi:hypothetical protein